MIPIPAEIVTPEALEQEHLEQAWLEDKEEHLRLEAELQKLEQRKQHLRSELPGYDSRLRHDARFPDSTDEGTDGIYSDRLSLNGDEPPVR